MSLTVRGRVTSVVRWRPEGRELVLRLVPEQGGGSRAQMVAWGVAATDVAEGEIVRMAGIRGRHPEWGAGIMWTSLERVAPVSMEGQIAFLRGMIKGLTKGHAEALIARAGDLDGVIRLCRESPAELEAVLPKARVIRARLRNADWSQRERDVDVFTTLQSAGLRLNQIQDLVRQFGAASLLQIARETPYRFAQLPNVGFASAERVAIFYAEAAGRTVDPFEQERLLYGLRDTVGHLTRQGDVCIPPERALRTVTRRLGLQDFPLAEVRPKLERALQECLTRKLLVQEFGDLYTRGMARSESQVSSILQRLSASGAQALRLSRAAILKAIGDRGLSEEQQEAVAMLSQCAVGVLVGGPGRGKTHTLKAFIDLLEKHNKQVLVLAPTGKAAKRASQMTGRKAETIHRACGLSREAELHTARRERVISRHEKLQADVVIVDEFSMVDLPVMYELLRRIRMGRTVLIAVGDPDQLPSVGPGQVLRDLLNCEVLPVAKLTTIFRQAGGSPIVDAADEINAGRMPTFEPDGYRCRIFDPGPCGGDVQREGAKLMTWVTQAILKWSQDLHIHPVRDVQVYAPQREAAAGIRVLNEALQAALNPTPGGGGGDRRGGVKLEGQFRPRIGDKVMQTENNYKLTRADDGELVEVNNGTVGFVQAIHDEERCIDIYFEDDDMTVRYKGAKEWGQLTPAYAMSIHKSQGSETRYACIVVDSGMNPRLISRALIYTGVTRAKEGVSYFGRKDILERGVGNTEGSNRTTHLADRLRAGRDALGGTGRPKIAIAKPKA